MTSFADECGLRATVHINRAAILKKRIHLHSCCRILSTKVSVVQPALNGGGVHTPQTLKLLTRCQSPRVKSTETRRLWTPFSLNKAKSDKKKTMGVFSDRLHVWQHSRWWCPGWTAKSAAWFIFLRPRSASVVSTCAALLLGGGDIVSWFSLDCCLTALFILCNLSYFVKEWCVHWLFSAHLVEKKTSSAAAN